MKKMTGIEAHNRLNEIDVEVTSLNALIKEEGDELATIVDEEGKTAKQAQIDVLNKTLADLGNEKNAIITQLTAVSFYIGVNKV